MNSLLLVLSGIVAGMPVGAAALWLHHARRQANNDRTDDPIPLAMARWERTGNNGMSPALRELRRLYPTHDIVPAMRLLDIVRVKGSAGEAIRTICAQWTVAAVVVDRRTAEISRILLWSDDERGSEKTDILRKVGFHVRTIPPHAGTDDLATAMAA